MPKDTDRKALEERVNAVDKKVLVVYVFMWSCGRGIGDCERDFFGMFCLMEIVRMSKIHLFPLS